MSTTGLPEDVCRFIDAHLPNIEHLDLFLFLASASPEARSANEAAMHLRVPVPVTEERLEQMRASELLEAVDDETGTRRYRWIPHSPAETHIVERLRNIYNTRPVTLIRYVYERPRGAAQQFADAFRLRKKPE